MPVDPGADDRKEAPGSTAAGGGMSVDAIAAESVVMFGCFGMTGGTGGAAKRAANARWLLARRSFTCCGVAPAGTRAETVSPFHAGDALLSVCEGSGGGGGEGGGRGGGG